MFHCNVPLCLKYMYQFSIILNYLHPKFIFIEFLFNAVFINIFDNNTSDLSCTYARWGLVYGQVCMQVIPIICSLLLK